ncbi:MAG: hypothetical protein JHC95_02325 [Solirubrobacteraceae bacterium]|nr:hypothetical protein [Solirubrobacteraceae bacterium]
MSLPRATRRGLTAIGLVLLSLLYPASSLAAPTVFGTKVTPRTVDAETRQILYYLDLRSGDQAEAFSVRFIAPKFATRGGRAEGESIDGPRATRLQGPGELGQLIQDPRFSQPCSDRDAAFHGYATGPASVDVSLPPNSGTTLAVRYLTGRRAPWVDSDYRLRFVVEPKLVGRYLAGSPFFGKAASPFGSQTRTSPGPTIKGRTGAHILLSSRPRGTWGGASSPRKVRSGAAVRVSGRILPGLSGKRIDLQARRAGGALRTFESVRTGRNGAFRATWRPSGRGTQEVWARYPTQPGELRADTTSCPLRFLVQR